MSNLGAYYDSISLPIVQKVLAGLGFGTVTYIGLQAAFNALQGLVVSNINSLSGATAALFYLAGFPQAIGIVLAAAAMRVSMIAVRRFQVL